MDTLTWILAGAVAMRAIAWVGLLAAAPKEDQLKRLLLPLVAFAAGSLLRGALPHLLPEAVAARGGAAPRRVVQDWRSPCIRFSQRSPSC